MGQGRVIAPTLKNEHTSHNSPAPFKELLLLPCTVRTKMAWNAEND